MTLVADNASETVNEAALDDVGSDPTSPAETASGQLAVAGTGVTYTLDSGTNTYGTLTLDANGSYTYTLTQPFDTTPDADNGAHTEIGAESYGYTATDAAGNTVTGTITIDIVDDVPMAIAPQNAYLVNTTTNALTGLLDVDGQVEDNFGADGAGSVLFSDSLNGATALDADGDPLTSGGLSITYSVSADGQTLTASTLAGEIFTIDLSINDSGQDTYVIEMSGTVDGGASSIDFSDDNYDFIGGNSAWAGFNTAADDDSRDLLLTPMIDGASAGSVNTNANEGGVSGGNSVGANEAIRVDYVVDLSGTPVNGTDYEDAGADNHVFDGHYQVNGAAATFTRTSGSTVLFKAFDDADGDNTVGDGTQDDITAVGISFGGDYELVAYDGTGGPFVTNVGGEEFIVVFAENGAGKLEASVEGIVGGAQVSVFTADGYNSVEYHYAAGNTFKIGDFGTTAIEPGEEVAFSVPVEIVDGDGDVASSSLDVLLLPEGTQDYSSESAGVSVTASDVSPDIIGSDYDDILTGNADSNILIGNEGNDTISGHGGDDLLIGGAGDDILTGGPGADVFAWNLGDEGISATPAEDTVTDFTPGTFGTDANADKLDLSDLLSGMQDGEDLSSYIQSTDDGTNTTLHISTSGDMTSGDVSAADQTIQLQNVVTSVSDLQNNGQLDIE
ncbi:type I secretion C-terminal target domain-containing protein [Halomonas sp. HG01]|uniref:type I secretion C-terminal target domain-containing protein n=1 Tax=Halomonas sp. HG01 TaxID=1609967 RepID=UPI001F27C99E|nr:type I secretion C-terminal target domain-containing protein [Halomonas sp. HG01]